MEEGVETMTIEELLNNKHPVNEKRGIGKSHGSFGELLQGVLPSGDKFLVTFPINRFSVAIFTSISSRADITVFPSRKKKSLKLAKEILSYFNKPIEGDLRITSQIQEGKGLASSTADLLATARAIQDYYQIKIPVPLIERFLREIEPSDGIMYPGVVVYDHQKLQKRKFLGSCPPFTVLAIDEGGHVDTLEFNNNDKKVSDNVKSEYQTMLKKLIKAFQNKNIYMIGNISTKSAIMNQRFLPKKSLNQVIKICEEIGGLGVVTAHSGTYLGILLFGNDPHYHIKLEDGLSRLNSLGYSVQLFHSIDKLDDKEVIIHASLND